MATTKIMLAGFGGQGILFAGKLIAYAALLEGRELSWLPSYGPEMRGGTANCSVTVSDEPIGSPLVVEPDVLVAMNQPSLDKFVGAVVPGGIVIADSTMISSIPDAADLPNEGVRIVALPATDMAEKNDLKGLANIILAGKLWELTQFCGRETLSAALAKCVPPKKAHLLEPNERAIQLGVEA